MGRFGKRTERFHGLSPDPNVAPSIMCGPMYACVIQYIPMKRTALFLKEQQLGKLQALSEKTGAPVAELIRRAIDAYLESRKKELK